MTFLLFGISVSDDPQKNRPCSRNRLRGVTDGGASLTQEKGGRAWVLDLNEGKLRTFIDGFNIGCNGVGMSGHFLNI